MWLQFLGALLLGSIFAKVVSTANNYLFSPATNLINDIFVRYIKPQASNKQILIVSRLMVVLLGIWSLFQSLGPNPSSKKLSTPTPSTPPRSPRSSSPPSSGGAPPPPQPSPASPPEPSSPSPGTSSLPTCQKS